MPNLALRKKPLMVVMKDRRIDGLYGYFVVVLNKENKSGANLTKLTIIIKMYSKARY